MGAGLTAGAFAGASVVSLMFLGFSLFGGDFEIGFQMAVVAFPVALILWAIGLAVVGAPGWILLHALGVRSRWAGAAWGVVAAFAGTFAAQAAILTYTSDWTAYLAGAGVIGLMGAPVGWVVVTTAYAPEGKTTR
jgi:hypothetical protein